MSASTCRRPAMPPCRLRFAPAWRRCCFGEERIALDAPARPRLAADLRVGLSPAVAAIDGPGTISGPAGASADGAGSSANAMAASAGALTVRFRRHLDPTTVSGREADILAPIRDRGRHAARLARRASRHAARRDGAAPPRPRGPPHRPGRLRGAVRRSGVAFGDDRLGLFSCDGSAQKQTLGANRTDSTGSDF